MPNAPTKPRTTRRTARERLIRLLAGYLPALPRDLRDAVLAAQQAPKLSEPEAASPLEIWGPDSDRVFVDRDGRAHRVEDLPADLRSEVQEALARPHEVLPTNEGLREASQLLHPDLRDLPVDRRIAITTAVARALDERRWHLERLERQVTHLETWAKRLPAPEAFPPTCPICGATPAPGDGHILKRWPASGMPELVCPSPGRGRWLNGLMFLGTTWLGDEGALCRYGDQVAAGGGTADGK
jgi:hypothetical protein